MKFMNVESGNFSGRYMEEAGAEGAAEGVTDGDTDDSTIEDIKLGDETNTDDGVKLSDDDKEGSEAKEADVAPEEYAEFDMPEGVELDGELLEAATPLFKELNLTQEQAQKLVSFQAEQTQKVGDALAQQHIDQVGEWKTQLRADKDIGGDKLEAALGDAKAFLKANGDPALTKYLDDTGLSNNPLLIKAFAKFGALTKEDNPGDSRVAGDNNADPEQARLDRMYSNSK